MLAEIETAVIARLREKAPQIISLETARSQEVLPSKPAYTLAITKGSIENITDETLKQYVELNIWLAFKNLKNDQARRQGAYPIVEAMAQLLYNQKLGLDIKKIKYTGFTDVTDEPERAESMAVYQLDFKTSYTVSQLEEEDVEDLLSVGLSYLLNGSDIPAVQDVVTLQNQTGGQ